MTALVVTLLVIKKFGCSDNLKDYKEAVSKTNDTVIFTLSNDTKNVTSIKFIIQFRAGYWYLNGINVTEKVTTTEYALKVKDVYAPVGFSYHCTDGIFYGPDAKQNLSLPKFQVRSYFNK